MYFSVPISPTGLLDIDYKYLDQGIVVSDAVAYVKLRQGYQARESWAAISEEEFAANLPPRPPEPQQSHEQRIAQLEQVIDTLLTGGETI